jgi:hypothetical protein
MSQHFNFLMNKENFIQQNQKQEAGSCKLLTTPGHQPKNVLFIEGKGKKEEEEQNLKKHCCISF